MRRFSLWRQSFWDAPIWLTLRNLPAEHLRVYLHLVHGPSADITGIYRLSVGQIADDTGVDADRVRTAIEEMANTGWCEYEPPIIWIVGHGNVTDQLGKSDWTSNPKWQTAAQRHLDALPALPIVDRFRRRWSLPPAAAATPPHHHGDKDKDAPYRYGTDTLSAELHGSIRLREGESR